MSKINLHGIFPPIPTPFINGNIAYDELATNIEKWSKTGLNGNVQWAEIISIQLQVYFFEGRKWNTKSTIRNRIYKK